VGHLASPSIVVQSYHSQNHFESEAGKLKTSTSRLLCPPKRTSSDATGMSALCHNRLMHRTIKPYLITASASESRLFIGSTSRRAHTPTSGRYFAPPHPATCPRSAESPPPSARRQTAG